MYSLIKVSLRQKAGRGHGKGQGPYDPAPFHNDIISHLLKIMYVHTQFKDEKLWRRGWF